MRVINLAIKDWIQIFRDWKSALFLVVMPIIFTAFFGMVMGTALAPDSEGDPRLPVALINQDKHGWLAGELAGLLEASSAVRPVNYAGEDPLEPEEWIQAGKYAGVVFIPSGYSEMMLEGDSPRLDLFLDQKTAAGQTAGTAVETAVNRLRGAVEAGKLSLSVLEENRSFENEQDRQLFLEKTVSHAAAEWQRPPLSVDRQFAVGELAGGDSDGQLEGYAQASSGMIVQFAIFGLITAAMILVIERNQKTLQRMLSTPISRGEIIAGHMLAMFVIIFLQQALLMIFGQFVFGIKYFREPFAVLLMMTALAFWAASLGLLISALAQGEEQVVTLSLIAMFLFASLGGAWFPLEVAGETFAAIGHFLPTSWAMDGFQNLLVRGLGLGSVLLPAGMLAAYAVGFFAIAVWRFRFE